uniref:Uncharacterized protein n=1 Tax=Oryza meridionalis TaxID=40149 RepID=A0A0E0DZ76_9ORYZ
MAPPYRGTAEINTKLKKTVKTVIPAWFHFQSKSPKIFADICYRTNANHVTVQGNIKLEEKKGKVLFIGDELCRSRHSFKQLPSFETTQMPPASLQGCQALLDAESWFDWASGRAFKMEVEAQA